MTILTILIVVMLNGSIMGATFNRQSSRPNSPRGEVTQSCQRETPFKIAILSVTHAPGYCSNVECKRHQNEWVIHGLWPDHGNNTSPEFCCYEPFLNTTSLQPIRKKLETQWRNLIQDRTDHNHWIHQWKKHGTCASSSRMRGQLNYFKTALELHDQLEMNQWMSRENITYGQSHQFDKVKNAIENGFGKRARYSCSKPASSTFPILSEVRFCYEPQNLTRIDCPTQRRHTCQHNSNKVYLKRV